MQRRAFRLRGSRYRAGRAVDGVAIRARWPVPSRQEAEGDQLPLAQIGPCSGAVVAKAVGRQPAVDVAALLRPRAPEVGHPLAEDVHLGLGPGLPPGFGRGGGLAGQGEGDPLFEERLIVGAQRGAAQSQIGRGLAGDLLQRYRGEPGGQSVGGGDGKAVAPSQPKRAASTAGIRVAVLAAGRATSQKAKSAKRAVNSGSRSPAKRGRNIPYETWRLLPFGSLCCRRFHHSAWSALQVKGEGRRALYFRQPQSRCGRRQHSRAASRVKRRISPPRISQMLSMPGPGGTVASQTALRP